MYNLNTFFLLLYTIFKSFYLWLTYTIKFFITNIFIFKHIYIMDLFIKYITCFNYNNIVELILTILILIYISYIILILSNWVINWNILYINILQYINLKSLLYFENTLLLNKAKLYLNKNSFIIQLPYECGFNPFNIIYKNIFVNWFLIALLFIIFDLELIFFYPLIVLLNKTVFFNDIIAIQLFLIILILGFVYELFLKLFDSLI